MANIYPHLEMYQAFGRISINTQNARLEIRQPKTDQYIQQPKADMRIDREPSRVTIDQTEAWHNLDLKSAMTRIEEVAAAGRQAVLDGIARRAREARELLHIERNKGKNLIALQAAENAPMAVIGTRYDTGHVPPFQSVRVHGSPGTLHVRWQTHPPVIQSEPNPPEYTYHPGGVEISVQQYSSLDIRAVGLFVDEKG
ncbi:hypothetical protein EWH99_04570 [Sporolactobacillus sp. THM7-7]|nr:hypothetical protein EWH99_04570 [Sporolactobacillus sp. THM7-7]